jgi:PAS domain S-box-containing protein
MNALEGSDTELARSKLRIAQLEREAIERSGDAAKGLRAQLDRYQSLVLAIAQVIWTNDARGEMVGEQPSWAAYTGQTPQEYAQRGWLNAVHPDDRAQNMALWERAVAERGPCEYEHRLRRHDGEYLYFSVRAVPVFADDGAIREWAGIHTDITQRKLTEQSLRDGERQFRELADAMPQIVWGARPDGQFDYYNRRWYEFTGRPTGTFGDASWADVVHPDDQQESLARWRAALASGDAYEIEYRLKRQQGDYRWYLTRALPVRDQACTITRWLGTCTDIDERKRTEDQLRASTAMLEQSNRDLADFATVASHDLREPLRKIHSFVGCLRDEQSQALSAEGRNYLDRIQNAASRMKTLVEDLLEFSRVSSKGKPFVPVDLNEVVTGVISDLDARLAQTGGRVEISNLPTVCSDPIQMRQLLQNLIGNALKFHRSDAVPLVRVSAQIITGVDAANSRAEPDGFCHISVEDNGIGFDEKYLDRVFTIFQRLHGRGEYEGTGIGLAICRKIVERHGGSITARSKPGQGATFIVTLPLGTAAETDPGNSQCFQAVTLPGSVT